MRFLTAPELTRCTALKVSDKFVADAFALRHPAEKRDLPKKYAHHELGFAVLSHDSAASLKRSVAYSVACRAHGAQRSTAVPRPDSDSYSSRPTAQCHARGRDGVAAPNSC